MKSNFRRNTQKRKNKVNRKSSKITGGFFRQPRVGIPYYFIYDLLPKDLRRRNDKLALSEWRDTFGWKEYKSIARNGFISPRDIDGIYFTFARNGYENNWSKFVQEKVEQEEVIQPMHNGDRALTDLTEDVEGADADDAAGDAGDDAAGDAGGDAAGVDDDAFDADVVEGAAANDDDNLEVVGGEGGEEEEDKTDMRNHVDATNNIEEDKAYRDTTGNMKYICLSLINLEQYKKKRIEDLCGWIAQKRERAPALTDAEQKEFEASRTGFGRFQRAIRLKKYENTKGRALMEEWMMISLFKTITFIDNGNDNGKLIFELDDVDAERLNKRKHLDENALNALSTRESVQRGIGIDQQQIIDYNKGKNNSSQFSPADYLTGKRWAKKVTGPAFLYYINHMFVRMSTPVNGGLKMNQKRNKTNISARGTKRTFCRKARNKTNKKRGTYKKNESVVDIQTRKK